MVLPKINYYYQWNAIETKTAARNSWQADLGTVPTRPAAKEDSGQNKHELYALFSGNPKQTQRSQTWEQKQNATTPQPTTRVVLDSPG